MTVVTVQGGSGAPVQNIDFTTTDTLDFAEQVAAAIDADTVSPFVITAGGNYTVTAAAIVSNAATGRTIITGSGNQSIIGGSKGLAFFAGNDATDQIVLAGGNNRLQFGSGSDAQVVTGRGNDSVLAAGSITVGMGGGLNSIHAALSAGTTAMIDSTGTDLINLGGGAATIAMSGKNTTVLAGAGSVSITDKGMGNIISLDAGAASIFESGRSASVSGGYGDVDYVVGGQADTIRPGSGADSVLVSGKAQMVLAGVGNDTITDTGSADNIVLNHAAAATVFAAGKGARISSSAGPAVIEDTGSANTVVGSSGAQTIFGGIGSVDFLGTGTTLYTARNASGGSDTIIGESAGSETVFGGKSDLILTGSTHLDFISEGGSATINGGNGADTILGTSSSRIVFFGSASGAVLQAGKGNETLNAGGASGAVTEMGGSGHARLTGGSGGNVFFGGTGNNTMTGGSGANSFVFVAGSTGGTDYITDFKEQTGMTQDKVELEGYGSSAVANALATAVYDASGATITLADHSKIVFRGLSSLNASNFSGS